MKSPKLPSGHALTRQEWKCRYLVAQASGKPARGRLLQTEGDPRHSSESSRIYFCSLDMHLSLVNLVQHVYLRDNIAVEERTRQ
jgi:hypothetical protein